MLLVFVTHARVCNWSNELQMSYLHIRTYIHTGSIYSSEEHTGVTHVQCASPVSPPTRGTHVCAHVQVVCVRQKEPSNQNQLVDLFLRARNAQKYKNRLFLNFETQTYIWSRTR